MKNRPDTQSSKVFTQRKINPRSPKDSFPVARNREKAPVQPKRPNSQRTPSSLSVLLVDDDVSLRQMIAVFLTYHGFAVTQAGDGFEAIKQYRLHSYDVIVTDHEMPGLSGLDFLRKLRAAESSPPCVLVSGSIPWNEPDIYSLLHPGVAIEKPFKILTLFDTINCLAKSHPQS